MTRIASDDASITLEDTQKVLDGQDATRSHYAGDDLTDAQVIALSTVDIAKTTPSPTTLMAMGDAMKPQQGMVSGMPRKVVASISHHKGLRHLEFGV